MIYEVLKGTDKLLKGFLQCILNGRLDCTSEDVRRTAIVFYLINDVILLSTSNLRVMSQGSICVAKGIQVHSESSDESTEEFEPTSSKKGVIVVRKTL